MSSVNALSPQHAPSLPKAWKSAIAVGGGVTMSPVIALLLALALASVLPALVVVMPLMAMSWAQMARSPARTVRFALRPQPAIAG